MFRCRIYSERPSSCQRYPWHDAQIIFPECQFVRGSHLIDYVELVREKGAENVARECIQCGKCCLQWRVDGLSSIPIARCLHLEVMCGKNSCNNDVEMIIKSLPITTIE